MIKNLIIDGVRGISSSIELGKINFIKGRNGSGKSTICKIITDLYKGKSDIKEGASTLFDSDGIEVTMKNGVVKNSPKIGTELFLGMPGAFMNKEVAGLNKTKEDKRKIISEVLGLDRDKFFEARGVDTDCKGLQSKIKEMKISSSTLVKELLEKENSYNELKKEFDSLGELKQSNKGVLDGYAYQISNYRMILDKYKTDKASLYLVQPKEVELVKTQVTKGNEDEYNSLVREVELAREKMVNSDERVNSLKDGKCPCCHQAFVDEKALAEATKENEELANNYKELANKLNSTTLVKSEIVEGNESEYSEYLAKKTRYEEDSQKEKELDKLIEDTNKTISDLEKKIQTFKVDEGNEEQYNSLKLQLDILNKDIETLKEKIKSLSTSDLELKLSLYKQTEEDYISFCEDKLSLNKDMKFVFYRKLKTPNSDGDLYTSDFSVEYKGQSYDELSSGYKVYVDILISKMFIDYYGLLDFVIIDNAEIDDNLLNRIIEEELQGFQVIVTRISDSDLEVEVI